MATDGAKIGIMDPAYFVGKKELLSWINDFLSLNLQKIEETASGCVSCQIIDACYPGSINLSKVNFAAKFDYEFTKNYKVLQDAFKKLKIDKHIAIERLVRGKYQDNLEMMQWMKAFFMTNYNEENEYDAVAARRSKKSKGNSKPVQRAAASNGSKKPSSTLGSSNAGSVSKSSRSGRDYNKEKENLKVNRGVSRTTAESKGSISSSELSALRLQMKESKAEKEALTKANADLSLCVDGLEKERDFYFGKLRDIEIYLQSVEDESVGSDDINPVVVDLKDKILKILYATEEDFEVAADPEP